MLKRTKLWWIVTWCCAFVIPALGLYETIALQVKWVVQGHTFTPFESTAFTVSQVILSLVVSAFLSWFFTQIGFRAEHQRYARAAVRNVFGFKDGIGRFQKTIDDRIKRISEHGNVAQNPDLLVEMLDHFYSLTKELDSQASNSVDDWVDISGISLKDISELKKLVRETNADAAMLLQQMRQSLDEGQEKERQENTTSTKSTEREALIERIMTRSQELSDRIQTLERKASVTTEPIIGGIDYWRGDQSSNPFVKESPLSRAAKDFRRLIRKP